MTPTRASVLAATGEELDRLVCQYVWCWYDDHYQKNPPEISSHPTPMLNLRDWIAARDLGPAFARELARITFGEMFADDGCDFVDSKDLWDLLSADPVDICRAAVLACLQGEG